jgi:hypothetical protein
MRDDAVEAAADCVEKRIVAERAHDRLAAGRFLSDAEERANETGIGKAYSLLGMAEAHAVLAPAIEGFSPTPEMPEIAEAQALLERLAWDRLGGHRAFIGDPCTSANPLIPAVRPSAAFRPQPTFPLSARCGRNAHMSGPSFLK